MFLVLVLLFTVIPAIEIYLLFSIGDLIGGLNTLFVIILTGVVGAALAKYQGLAVINKVKSSMELGEIPTTQFTHALLIFGGGILLLTPGFLTDLLGLCMVLPITRSFLALFMRSIFETSLKTGTSHFYSSKNRSNHQTNGPLEVEPDVFETQFHETSSEDTESK